MRELSAADLLFGLVLSTCLSGLVQGRGLFYERDPIIDSVHVEGHQSITGRILLVAWSTLAVGKTCSVVELEYDFLKSSK